MAYFFWIAGNGFDIFWKSHILSANISETCLTLWVCRPTTQYTNTLILISGYFVLNKIYLIFKRLQIKKKRGFSIVEHPQPLPLLVDCPLKKELFCGFPLIGIICKYTWLCFFGTLQRVTYLVYAAVHTLDKSLFTRY